MYDYLAIMLDRELWRVHQGAIGFETWTPNPNDPLASASRGS